MTPFELEEPAKKKQQRGYGAYRAATIFVAEAVGTGVLALPGAAVTLGTGAFVAIVAAEVVLNLYAGHLLAAAAEAAERRTSYAACRSTTSAMWDFVGDDDDALWNDEETEEDAEPARDFVELAAVLGAGRATRVAIAMAWFANLVLILGNYLVVMARSLRTATALSGCPVLTSLAISCFVVLCLAQLPTLAQLGQGAAQLSFAAVAAILGICAWYLSLRGYFVETSRGDAAAATWIFRGPLAATPRPRPEYSVEIHARLRYTPPGPPPVGPSESSPFAAAAAITTITFAMISAKLFLNVLSPRGYSADGSRRRRGCDVDILWRRRG